LTWEPQRGPQTSALLADWCDELFFGGERGGGKSDFQLGYQEDGALRYGKDHRGIMFRKTYAELEELQARAMEIFPSSGGIYKTQPSAEYAFSNSWYWPNGASVKMRYIEREEDYGRYHGHSYCVGVETPILMANGAYKAIGKIRRGEMVQTLEGAKPVLRVIEPYLAPCVTLTTSRGSQIQPTWHPVLSSVEPLFGSQIDASKTTEQPLQSWNSAESLACDFRTTPDFGALSADGRIGHKATEQTRPESLPLGGWLFPVVLAELSPQKDRGQNATERHGLGKSGGWRSAVYRLATSFLYWGQQPLLERAAQVLGLAGISPFASRDAHAPCGRLGLPEVLGSPVDCLLYSRSSDARLQLAARSAKSSAPSPADAEAQARVETPAGGMDCIRGDIPQALYTYTHPYTKAQRAGAVPVSVGTAHIGWHGFAWVCDLEVKDANHYITENGAVNKNSAISADEVTEYASPGGIMRMISTLRSPAGIPCSMRLTGNPGGIGHAWVKQRYIDCAPPYTPFTDPDTGFTRMFIPSKTSDNIILLAKDPRYRDRIKAATGGNEALRKAWLEGNWDIVAGAFFDCWDKRRHVVKPFDIPEGWTRFRSGDWGSARPFSFGWWAVVSDDYNTNEGITLPRGCIVRYREWYGCKKDSTGQQIYNTGLKMDADVVGRELAALEAAERKKMDGVLDPAAFAHDGGPSIAERLEDGSGMKVQWRRADNTRVAKVGAIGGWDAMRARLIGESDDRPMLVMFDTCADSIRTIPSLQHDKNRIEDVDTEGEDHAGDDVRYACNSRPWLPPKQDKPPPKWATDLSFNDMRDRQRKAREMAE